MLATKQNMTIGMYTVEACRKKYPIIPIWIIATGLAALMSSSIIHPTKEQIEKMIQDSINATLNTKETIQVN